MQGIRGACSLFLWSQHALIVNAVVVVAAVAIAIAP